MNRRWAEEPATARAARCSTTFFRRRSARFAALCKQDNTMPKVLVSTVINAPIERVWRTAADYNGLPSWMPGMKDSTIEPGQTPREMGAVLKLGMAGTKEVLRERLEALDDKTHTITYSVLEGPLP